jgi:hypothetical protein
MLAYRRSEFMHGKQLIKLSASICLTMLINNVTIVADAIESIQLRYARGSFGLIYKRELQQQPYTENESLKNQHK